MQDTQEEKNTLTVVSILPSIEHLLSERARAVFDNVVLQSPATFYFGIVHADTEDAAAEALTYYDFAERLNDVVAAFDGTPRESREGVHCARVDSALCAPLMIPLSGKRYILVAYLNVMDAPTGDHGRLWVNVIVGDRLRCNAEGALPENPPGVTTPPAPPETDYFVNSLRR